MERKEPSKFVSARAVALVGLMTASLTCGKLALSFLPNIEIVTLLCGVYGYVFGIYGIVSAVLFVCIEPLIYGFGSWILTYLIYWPAVALVFMMLRRAGVKGRLVLTAVAVGMTVCFGVLSSVIETAFYLGINGSYFKNLLLYYTRGVVFYALQVAINLVVFPTLFLFLSDKLERLGRMYKLV